MTLGIWPDLLKSWACFGVLPIQFGFSSTFDYTFPLLTLPALNRIFSKNVFAKVVTFFFPIVQFFRIRKVQRRERRLAHRRLHRPRHPAVKTVANRQPTRKKDLRRKPISRQRQRVTPLRRRRRRMVTLRRSRRKARKERMTKKRKTLTKKRKTKHQTQTRKERYDPDCQNADLMPR